MRKISVIIPCYNVEVFIDRCLTSIFNQTIEKNSLEIICVDDASTDNTWERLQAWEGLYPDNIIIVHQEINRRSGGARNTGLQYASADWVAFVDADDWLEPDYFEKLYTQAIQFNCDVVSCGFKPDWSEALVYFDKIQRQDNMAGEYILADSGEKKMKLYEYSGLGVGPWAKIVRKNLLMDFYIFFPENVTYEDNYWLPLLYIYGERVYQITENLYHYSQNSSSTVNSRNKAHHIDWITVQLMKWKDYQRRGLWKKYYELMASDALYNAVGVINNFILRYDDPPFSLFLLESEVIRQQVPDYTGIKYVDKLPELSRLYLKALYTDMDITAFKQLVYKIKKYYGIV